MVWRLRARIQILEKTDVLLVEMRRSLEPSLVKTGEDKEEETRAGLDFGSPWKMLCLCLLGESNIIPTRWVGARGDPGETKTSMNLHVVTDKASFSCCQDPEVLPCPGYVLSRVPLFATPWTVAHQAPLSMGILQARILERGAMPSSRGSSQPREQTHIYVSCIGRQTLHH